MTNCQTFSPLGGFSDGIALAINVPTSKNDGSVHNPHVRVGGEFIQIDTVKPPTMSGDVLLAARLRQITTAKASFAVLSRADTADTQLLLINLNSIPAGVRRRFDPFVINAWVTFEGDAEIVLAHPASGKCLVEFTRDEQALLVFDRDGAVYRLVRRNGTLIQDHLSPLEMAKERVVLIRQQIKALNDEEEGAGVLRLHGILGGAVKLLNIAITNTDVRKVFVDLLADYTDSMGTTMRKETNTLLHAYRDPRAVMFAEGFDNVVNLAERRAAPAKSRKDKSERAARDRELRNKMRGASGGGQKKQAKGGSK